MSERATIALALDAGNTRIKWQLFSSGRAHASGAMPREELVSHPESSFKFLGDYLKGFPAPTILVVSCAREEDEPLLRGFLKPLDAPVHFLHLADPTPIPVHYTSGKPGPDRLAAAIGLHDYFPGEPAISIDFGTATNTVVVNADGAMVGGSILPGLKLQADVLREVTKGRLPQIDLTVPLPIDFPRSTDEAIRLGIILGHVGAVERLITHHRSALGDPTIPCLVTGGHADLVLPHLNLDVARSGNLILHGLACWAHCSPMAGD